MVGEDCSDHLPAPVWMTVVPAVQPEPLHPETSAGCRQRSHGGRRARGTRGRRVCRGEVF